MNGNYVKPGIAAIALALLFPLYWSIVLVVGADGQDFQQALREDMLTLTWIDGLFLLIGILEIYIYMSLVRAFNDQLNSNAARILLYIIIGSIFFFHASIFADLFLVFFQDSTSSETIDGIVGTSVFTAIAALVVYVIAGLGLSVVILTKNSVNAPLIKYFAVMLLIICLLQATILFAIVNLLMFPVALIILAVYFLKDPDTLEVI